MPSTSTMLRAPWRPFCLCILAGCREISAAPSSRAGSDACLTTYADAQTRPPISAVQTAGISIVRERAPNPRWRTSARGFPGAFVSRSRCCRLSSAATHSRGSARCLYCGESDAAQTWRLRRCLGNGLRARRRLLSRSADRLAAFQKAVYLGSRRRGGNAVDPGADGPDGRSGAASRAWLERAARNGLLDYTDAYNFHFYGFAEDLNGVIRPIGVLSNDGHAPDGRARLRSRLDHRMRPECVELAIFSIPHGDTPSRVHVATARQARVAKMWPSSSLHLVHEGDPYALTLAPDRPLPAWTVYSDYAGGTLSRRDRSSTRRERRIRLSCSGCRSAHRDSAQGFRQLPLLGAGADAGTMRIYNFGPQPTHGHLEAGALPHVALSSPMLSVVAPKDNAPGLTRLVLIQTRDCADGKSGRPGHAHPLTPVYFRDFWNAASATSEELCGTYLVWKPCRTKRSLRRNRSRSCRPSVGRSDILS